MFNSLTRQLVVIITVFLPIPALGITLLTHLLLRSTLSDELRLPLIIIGSTVISMLGATLIGLFIRNRLRPLWQLTHAARSMGQGDLKTPIQTTATTPEIATLAHTLEKSRNRILEMMDETRRRHEVQSYFLANMSHEFRTPLSGMKVSIELLHENARHLSHAELEELLTSLDMSVTTMQRLIDNLLESGKIESKRFNLRRRQSAVEPLMGEAIQVMQPLMSRRKQTLLVDEPLYIPDLHVDPTRILQVIVNLLSNASKYSPMGARIDMVVEVNPSDVCFAIRDRGEGIPSERRETVFKRFERLETGSETDYGTGLGLSVVKAIVEGHGGTVGIEPRDGGGTAFWFTLPLSASAA